MLPVWVRPFGELSPDVEVTRRTIGFRGFSDTRFSDFARKSSFRRQIPGTLVAKIHDNVGIGPTGSFTRVHDSGLIIQGSGLAFETKEHVAATPLQRGRYFQRHFLP